MASYDPVYVLNTTVLSNNTAVAGNYEAPFLIGAWRSVYDSRDNRTFVISVNSNYLVGIDDRNQTASAWIPLLTSPLDLVYDPMTNAVYVSLWDAYNSLGYIATVNATTETVVHTGGLGSSEILAMTVDATRGYLFTVCNCQFAPFGYPFLLELSLKNTSSNSLYIGGTRAQLAFDAATQFVYLSDYYGGTVTAYNCSNVSSMTSVTSISVGSNPSRLAVDVADSTLFVADAGQNRTTVIRTNNNTILANITTVPAASDPELDPVHDLVYLLGAPSGMVYVLNGTNGSLLRSFPVNQSSDFGSIDYQLGLLLVASAQWASFAVVSLSNDTVLGTAFLGNLAATGLTYDPQNLFLYAAFGGAAGDRVAVINGTSNRIARWVDLPGSAPAQTVYDGATGNLLILNATGLVEVNSTTEAIGRFVAVGGPSVSTYDPASKNVFSIDANGSISVVGGSNLTLFAYLYRSGWSPSALLDAPSDHEVFVLDCCSGYVWIINTSSDRIVAGVSISGSGCYPDGMAYDARTDQVFVANGNCGTLSVMDSHGNVGPSIPIYNTQSAVVYDPVANGLVVLNANSHQAYFVADSNDTLTENFLVGGGAIAGTFDPANGEAYTVNNYQGTLSEVAATLESVSLQALPPTVPVNRSLQLLAVVNGGRPPFSFQYSGLPSGCVGANASSISCSPDLTGNYTVILTVNDSSGGSGQQGSRAVSVVPDLAIRSFGASPATIRIGGTTSLSVATAGGTGGLTLSYLGLPPGCSSASITPLSCSPNASGTFSIHLTVSDSSGEAVNASTSLIVLPALPPPQYPVTFFETGLAPGTNWSVTMNGMEIWSTHPTLSFSELNGTYSYAVTQLGVYTMTPTFGSVGVLGGPATVNVQFTPIPASVTFVETGLAATLVWGVAIDGRDWYTSTTEVTVLEAIGPQSFTVLPPRGYASQPASGSVTVGTSPVTVPLIFSLGPPPVRAPSKFSVIFTETGLPQGTPWSVTVGGTTNSTSSATLRLLELNGSYSFRVTNSSGYVPTPGNGTLSVDGQALSVAVHFALAPTGPPTTTISNAPAGLPLYVYLAIGVAIAVAVVAVLLIRSRGRRPPPGSGPVTGSAPQPSGGDPPPSAHPPVESPFSPESSVESDPALVSSLPSGSASALNPVAGAAATAAANRVCGGCGYSNEPWLTNCRRCMRPLSST